MLAYRILDGDSQILYANQPIQANEPLSHSVSMEPGQEYATDRYGPSCICPKCVASYKPHEVYICPKPKCRTPIALEKSQSDWWLHSDHPTGGIRCAKCKTIVDTTWYSIIVSDLLPMVDSIKLYEKASKTMSKIHNQKTDAGRLLLSLWSDQSPSLQVNSMLLPIVEYLLLTEEDNCGKFSLNYVRVCLYLLDLVALLRKDNYQFEAAFDLQSKLLDISKVVKCVVASDVQPIFLDYIQQLI